MGFPSVDKQNFITFDVESIGIILISEKMQSIL